MSFGTTRRAHEGRIIYKMIEELFEKAPLITVRPFIEVVYKKPYKVKTFAKPVGDSFSLKLRIRDDIAEKAITDPEAVMSLLNTEVNKMIDILN